MNNCDLQPCQIDAIRKYCNEILSEEWDYSEGDEVWCAGFRTACQKILDIANQNAPIKRWGTDIYAIDPVDSNRGIVHYMGPTIQALTQKEAFEFCQNHGLGYLHIGDELVMEIPCKPGTFEADFDKKIDYEEPNLN